MHVLMQVSFLSLKMMLCMPILESLVSGASFTIIINLISLTEEISLQVYFCSSTGYDPIAVATGHNGLVAVYPLKVSISRSQLNDRSTMEVLEEV